MKTKIETVETTEQVSEWVKKLKLRTTRVTCVRPDDTSSVLKNETPGVEPKIRKLDGN